MYALNSLRSFRVASPLLAVLALLLAAMTLPGCGKSDSSAPQANTGADQTPPIVLPPNSVLVTFTYDSSKQAWIQDATQSFNQSQVKTPSGKIVQVNAIPLGSGDCIEELLNDRRQADITSPASAAFINRGNAQWQTKTGKDLLGPTQNLCLSPVVIAMWKPMAEALGWGTKRVGWSDILAMVKNPQGWGAYGHPEWGKFKFGHTHPEYSNSGLMSALAIVYAGVGNGKVAGLTADDVNNPATADFLGQIEGGVEHYGTSTGFFADKLVEAGPSYLSAAILYENLVVASYAHKDKMTFPLVAIYPREGTFWSDHPIGIVQRDWVTDDKKAGAKIYIDYLLAEPQQQKALSFGFRPANTKVAVASPISRDFGVDPSEPQTTLEIPSVAVIDQIIKLWHKEKKKANVVLVLDTSGSMDEDQKLINAKSGCKQLIDLLDDSDCFSLIRFSSDMSWAPGQGQPLSQNRDAVKGTIDSLIADGETRLFDTIDVAVNYLEQNPQDDKISAVVVLTDGIDNKSTIKEEQLVQRLTPRGEKRGLRVFTIAYGKVGDTQSVDTTVLKRIATATRAKFFQGTPENIREVFKEIATFF